MSAVKVRTGIPALVTSKAMMICVVFVLICLPFLIYFMVAWNDATGTWRTLYAIAAAAPGCGVLAALLSMCAVWLRRRKAVLVVDDFINIVHTGVHFPVSELARVQLWSDIRGSYAAFLPAHIGERVERDGVASIKPYVVAFPEGADPQPFEVVEFLLEDHPALEVDRLGRLT
ncbi:hypothetical protein SFC07_00835 [Corynebacterium callunae]|uniref:hypothetical protein n=1 Tax=Corynebacterium callunae TaxID=1721 RepID=UPI003982D221